ncbi:hypothetical protein [Agrococcus jejuensis]|uniref:Uncharacterized protein n=1 Tax=Agrococcus jejuensis TaxID=399736 RepID=A0A1G8E7I7_9MICO|nr:hypothetical protein [Agrococcus jejuensis]SDH65928.1 hypothetical protein SAMN04489720_1921 [Agrococcus jejuensis]
MDNPLYVIGGIAVILFLIAVPFIRRWSRRKGAEIGEAAGRRFAEGQVAKADASVPKMIAQIAVTMVLHAPEAQARAIMAEATRKGADFPERPDGTWGMRFLDPADGVAELVPGPQGTLVRVREFGEPMGYPTLGPVWLRLRGRIEKAAKAAQVQVSEGPVQQYVRHAPPTGDKGRWALAD